MPPMIMATAVFSGNCEYLSKEQWLPPVECSGGMWTESYQIQAFKCNFGPIDGLECYNRSQYTDSSP